MFMLLQHLVIIIFVTGILARPEPPVNSYLAPNQGVGNGNGGIPSGSYSSPNGAPGNINIF